MSRFAFIALLLVFAAHSADAQQSAQPADSAQAIYKVGENGVKPPIFTNMPEAEFSPEARAKKINGLCLVSLVVDVTGMPGNMKALRCTDPVFEKISLAAVAQYRFKPATQSDGTPVVVQIHIEINFRRSDFNDPVTLARYRISTPPGTTSNSPGVDGVYPLTKSVSPPAITNFSDDGYGNAAFPLPDKSACDVVLTVSAKGKPSDPTIIQCDEPFLEKPAVASLLKSRYKPGALNGTAVPVRVSIHLEFGGFTPTK